MKNEETSIILIVVVVAIVLFVGYNFLGKIKAAPITLVPAGTQAAVNPASQAALNAATVGSAQGTAAAATAAAQQAAAASNVAAYGAVGTGLGNLISSRSDATSGSADSGGNDYYSGY